MFEFDREKAYRLVDVLDRNGNTKAESGQFYMDRVGCIAVDVSISSYAYMVFVEDANKRWIHRLLRTSTVQNVFETEGKIHLVTANSVYIFEPAVRQEPVYRDEPNLIELYLEADGLNFVRGYFYDAKAKPHELELDVHDGMFSTSCLIYVKDSSRDFVCRYFPYDSCVTFYNTLYGQQDYSLPVLIHNVGDRPLRITFERFPAVWTIQPGKSKQIIPYCGENADETD